MGTSAPTSNVDPFTGGGAYVPGSASNFPQPGSHNNDSIYANADPFTGGNLRTLAPYSSGDAHQLDCVLMRCRICLATMLWSCKSAKSLLLSCVNFQLLDQSMYSPGEHAT